MSPACTAHSRGGQLTPIPYPRHALPDKLFVVLRDSPDIRCQRAWSELLNNSFLPFSTIPLNSPEHAPVNQLLHLKAGSALLEPAYSFKLEAAFTITIFFLDGAEEQVVTGMNYRLKLKVTLDGQEKSAVAVVRWQAWNEKTPYTLTSWDWQ